jgi:hypothetical protein
MRIKKKTLKSWLYKIIVVLIVLSLVLSVLIYIIQ